MSTQPVRPLAPLLSAIIPGVGQLTAAKLRSGCIFLLLYLLALSAFFVGAWRDTLDGWVILCFPLIVLPLVSPMPLLLGLRATIPTLRWLALGGATLLFAIVSGGIAVQLVTRISGLRPYRVSSESMSPTIASGQGIMIDSRYYQNHPIVDGDIVAFHHNNYVIIKRVSGLPGEKIEFRNGILLRDGVAVPEPYTRVPDRNAEPVSVDTPERTVAAGELFVSGDWRDRSLDSRMEEFGAVHTSDVMGKLVFKYGKP